MEEFDKILLVKDFIPHVKYDKELKEPVFTDLKLSQYNKIKNKTESIRQNKIKNKVRQQEIEIELKSELLTDNKRTQLINEFNSLSLYGCSFDDTEKIAEALDLLLGVRVCYTYTNYIICNLCKKYFKLQLGISDVKFTIDEINELIYDMKKYLKLGFSFDSIWLVYNAIMLHEYPKVWKKYHDVCLEINEVYPNEMNSLSEYLYKIKEPHGFIWNIYTMFSHMLEGINIDTFIQCYPIAKYVDKEGISKDYYSSIEAYDTIVKEYGKVLDNTSSKLMLSEIKFTEPILFDIAVKMFSVISYQTGMDTSELLLNFLNEAHEEVNRPKLKVIKCGNK